MKNFKVPQGPGVGRLAQVLVIGGAAVYGFTHSLFNVEGGHRYISTNFTFAKHILNLILTNVTNPSGPFPKLLQKNLTFLRLFPLSGPLFSTG